MSTTLNRLFLSSCTLMFCIALLSGCINNSTNPIELQPSDFEISDIKNIIWTLDKSGYEPFRLIFNEDQFLGYDGCNWFGSRFEARNDSIFPEGVVQTLRLCDVKSYSVQHLTEPYRLSIAKNELYILAGNTIHTYKSDIIDSVVNSPLLNTWQLSASTDPEFAELQQQQLLPILSFNEERRFKIAWYCTPENIFGCDEIFGIFGIGANSKIFFYRTGWQNHAQGLDFMERILSASSYRIETNNGHNETLTLFHKNGIKYEFTVAIDVIPEPEIVHYTQISRPFTQSTYYSYENYDAVPVLKKLLASNFVIREAWNATGEWDCPLRIATYPQLIVRLDSPDARISDYSFSADSTRLQIYGVTAGCKPNWEHYKFGK